jgi:hypothetical protein
MTVVVAYAAAAKEQALVRVIDEMAGITLAFNYAVNLADKHTPPAALDRLKSAMQRGKQIATEIKQEHEKDDPTNFKHSLAGHFLENLPILERHYEDALRWRIQSTGKLQESARSLMGYLGEMAIKAHQLHPQHREI